MPKDRDFKADPMSGDVVKVDTRPPSASNQQGGKLEFIRVLALVGEAVIHQYATPEGVGTGDVTIESVEQWKARLSVGNVSLVWARAGK